MGVVTRRPHARSSFRIAVAVAVLAVAAPRARADAPAPAPAPAAAIPPKPAATAVTSTWRERRIRAVAIAGGAALYIASETIAKDALAPDTCRWCGVSNVDGGFRRLAVWDEPSRAKQLSDIVGYGVVPVAMTGLLALASSDAGWRRAAVLTDDMLAMLEIIVGTQLVTQAVKVTAGRRRPYAHYATDPAPLSQEDNLSFFSGHSSLTFSLAVGAGMIAHRRGYRLEPVIWATGLALAASTAYLRMAADRHYLSDVLLGSAVGAVGGAVIPHLTGSLRGNISITPHPRGLALAGRF